MKILFVVKNMKLSNGVASFTMNYYRELKKKNIFIDFLVVSDVGSTYYDEIIKNGDKVFILPSYKKSFFSMIKSLKEIFKENEYDIIHCNVVNSGILVLYYAKKYGVNVRILHSHSSQSGDTKIKIMRNKIFRKISKSLATTYFACSELAGKDLFGKEKFFVIENAIDIERYMYNEEVRNKIRKNNNVKEDMNIILTVGRITKQKNPFFIVDIMNEIKKESNNFMLWWLGNGEMERQIREYIKKNELEENIVLFGASSCVNEYYSAADVFILPSFFEGLPVVGIEAQISGLPCLFSNNITSETSISENSYYLPIDDVKIWKSKINELLNSKDREILFNGVDVKKYDITNNVNKLFEEYCRLLNENQK